MSKRLVLATVFVAAAIATSADAGCARKCRSTIKACYQEFCNPPDFAVEVRACKLGIHAGVIESCKRQGAATACPKKRCPVANEGPL
ncbi:MAG: hypothetical protein ACREQL_11250 [Candidatus Binatia bacterium]